MSDLTIADWFWAQRAMTPTSQPGNARHKITRPFSATFGTLARLIAMLLLCTGGSSG